MFINIVFYYSSKRDSKYKDGNLFLVTIPEYTIESIDVQKIIISYNRQLNILLSISFIISIISILLFNLFPPLITVFIFFVLIFINTVSMQIPFKKAREKLLKIKKQNSWLILNNIKYKIDLKASSPYIEQSTFKLKHFYCVIIIDIYIFLLMIKYKADVIIYPFIILQMIFLLKN